MAKIDLYPKKTYTLGMYLEKMKTNFKRYMHPDVHSNTIYNSWDKETTLMYIEMDGLKKNMWNGILLSHKKN